MRSLTLIAATAMLMLLASCSHDKERAELIGFWQSTDAKQSASIEFFKDDTAYFGGKAGEILDWKVMKLFAEFQMQLAQNSITFEVVDDDQVKFDGDFMQVLDKLSGGAEPGAGMMPGYEMGDFSPSSTLTFSISGDELTLTNDGGKSLKLRRRL